MTGRELELVEEALALPASSRVEIIKALTDSLLSDSPKIEIEKAWFQEAESRMQGFMNRDLDAYPGEEVMCDLRSRHGN